MSKNELKIILQKYGLMPNKLLGQNFLIDRAVLKKIIAAADLSKDDIVLEIGPGLGVLTEALAAQAGQVVAVEKDKKMAEIVKNVLNDRNIRNVRVVQNDILKASFLKPDFKNLGFENWNLFGNWKLEIGNYKIVANIPYYLTSNLIRKFLETPIRPKFMVLMIQKEVAQRICAKPPKMSLLAVSVQFYAQPKIVSYVSKNSFWPRPKVDSAVIKIIPHNIFYCHSRPASKCGVNSSGNPDDTGSRIKCGMTEGKKEHFFRVVRAGFAHPRKQLINNLSQGLKVDRAKISATLKKIGLAPEQRAETLGVTDWIKLTDTLHLGDSGDVARRQNRQDAARIDFNKSPRGKTTKNYQIKNIAKYLR